ncbi:hypothetical protein K438DRAFT_1559618, partial [Mycena galopus ATCC 62051]
MDSSSNQHQQATTSTSHQPTQPEVRSSARVKAAKQKAKDNDSDPQSSSALPTARQRSKRTAKSKANEATDTTTNRSAKRNPPQPTLTINEPVRDPKGKKRAAPEPNSDEEESAGPSKRPRTTSYSLRSSTLKEPSDMPRKTR